MNRNQELVVELKSKLEKVKDNTELIASDSTLDILKALDEIEITVDILRATKIGSVVNGLKKKMDAGSNKDYAAKLVSKWKSTWENKKTTEEPTKKETKSSKSSIGNDSSSSSSSNSSSSSSSSSQSSSKAASEITDVEFKRKFDKLGKVRQKIVTMFKTVLDKNMDCLDDVKAQLALEIEEGTNKVHPSDRGDKEEKNYLTKARQIYSNLKANAKLCERMLTGEVEAGKIAFMKSQDLATDEMKKARNTVSKETAEAAQSDFWLHNKSRIDEANGVESVGNMYKCRKCGSYKTSFTQLQTRSSDEPMTVYVTCSICTFRYRC